MLSNTSSRNYSSTKTYMMKDILEATPEKLLLKVYDFAISNAKQGNLEKTNKAINQLISGLRFDEECNEISIGLLQLYQFCQEQMRKNEFDIVVKILGELKTTWQGIFKLKKNSKAG